MSTDAPIRITRRITAGDTVLIPLTIHGYDDNPLDVTGWSIAAAAKTNRSDATALSTATVSRSGGPYADDETVGQITVEFAAADTSGWPAGTVEIEVELVSPVGREHTIAEGPFDVRPEIV